MLNSLRRVSDMLSTDQIFNVNPYSQASGEKGRLLLTELNELTDYHLDRCPEYRKILNGVYGEVVRQSTSLNDVPFLPVRLFKKFQLKSVVDKEVQKTFTSSGTSGQVVSRIAIDRDTSIRQSKALAAIVTSFLGPKRLPMVIFDAAPKLQKADSLSARSAGVLGFASFGHDHFYALDDHMELNIDGLLKYLGKHKGANIFFFGFTFIIWQHIYHKLKRAGVTLPKSQSILVHGGGWKKLTEQSVDNDTFKCEIKSICGISRIHNFYGMVEQVGSIFMECEHGYLHAPAFADVLTRNPAGGMDVLPTGTAGVLQVMSILPKSYPGHSLLTEDLGVVVGHDDCPCGRLGSRFLVHGRMTRSELRGCSDTYAQSTGVSNPDSPQEIQKFVPIISQSTNPEDLIPDSFISQRPLCVFDSMIIDFLDHLSAKIFNLPNGKNYPDLFALAFWLRRSHVQQMIDEYVNTIPVNALLMPRGVVFHIAPSNVDTMFVYSLALSMLCGNINIVRIPQEQAERVKILCELLRSILADSRWSDLASRMILLTYPHQEHVSRWISEQSNVRVIWGGDRTVSLIKSIAAKPSTKDVVFVDKRSFALVNVEKYIAMPDQMVMDISRKFYADAYSFDQMACSSPKQVIFVGERLKSESACERFWHQLALELSRQNIVDDPNTAVDKFVSACELAADDGYMRFFKGGIPLKVAIFNRVEKALAENSSVAGFFVECRVETVEEIAPVISGSHQTVTCIGFTTDERKTMANVLCRRGVDRVVDVGDALSFNQIWDGYVLFSEFSRRVSI